MKAVDIVENRTTSPPSPTRSIAPSPLHTVDLIVLSKVPFEIAVRSIVSKRTLGKVAGPRLVSIPLRARDRGSFMLPSYT